MSADLTSLRVDANRTVFVTSNTGSLTFIKAIETLETGGLRASRAVVAALDASARSALIGTRRAQLARGVALQIYLTLP